MVTIPRYSGNVTPATTVTTTATTPTVTAMPTIMPTPTPTPFDSTYTSYATSPTNYMGTAELLKAINSNYSFNNYYNYTYLLSTLYSTPRNNQNYNDLLSQLNFPLTFQSYNNYLNMPRPMRWFSNLFVRKDQDFKTDTSKLPILKNVYNPELSKTLARIAYQNALATDTRGWCAKGVMDSLQRTGIDKNGNTRVAAAYQAVDKFKQHQDKFQRVNITDRNDLSKLPAGCIIVWNKSEGHPYGHITVTLGLIQDPKNPKNKYIGEASDHVQPLITNRNADFAVYVPIENKKSGKK